MTDTDFFIISHFIHISRDHAFVSWFSVHDLTK